MALELVASQEADMVAMWDTSGAKDIGIEVIPADHFNARGMRRVYGRGDCYGRGRKFNMDVWMTSDGRLMARFWARRSDVDQLSYEVIWPNRPQLFLDVDLCANNEAWIPQALRDEYDSWILSEF